MSKPLEAMEASPVDQSSDYGGYGSEGFEQARRGSRVSGFRVAFSDIRGRDSIVRSFGQFEDLQRFVIR